MNSYEKALRAARSLPELDTVLQNYLASKNITTFSFTYYSYHLNALNKLKYDFASANFLIWHQHYQENHYEEIDSTMEKVRQITLPTFWNLQQQLQEAKTEKEKQMRLDSIQFGAEKGISIPIHGPRGDFANFLVVQMRGENCLEQGFELQYELFLCGYYYYSYLQPLLLKKQSANKKYQLNNREMQCLILTANHLSVADIAKRLNLTERTINYHMQRMNKKLGVKNKYQAVVEALQNGLLS